MYAHGRDSSLARQFEEDDCDKILHMLMILESRATLQGKAGTHSEGAIEHLGPHKETQKYRCPNKETQKHRCPEFSSNQASGHTCLQKRPDAPQTDTDMPPDFATLPLKERNRLSAKRSRKRKNDEMARLREENITLCGLTKKLKEENDRLRQMVMEKLGSQVSQP
jgi:hypothetical protein